MNVVGSVVKKFQQETSFHRVAISLASRKHEENPKESKSGVMDMNGPQRVPSAILHKMELLTGVWHGQVNLAPSQLFPNGLTATATYSGQLNLSGNVVVGHEQYRHQLHLIHQAITIFGWDWDRQQFLLYRFESGQPFPTAPAFGQWQDQVLVLQDTTEHGGFSFIYAFQDQSCSIEKRSVSHPGGAEHLVFHGKYERLGQ